MVKIWVSSLPRTAGDTLGNYFLSKPILVKWKKWIKVKSTMEVERDNWSMKLKILLKWFIDFVSL